MDVEIERLEKELEKYVKKLEQMQKDWSATREGSRYGSEYLEMQVKVYQEMIWETKREIIKRKNFLKKIPGIIK